MILIDYSLLFSAAAYVQWYKNPGDFDAASTDTALTGILNYNEKFRAQYGEMVICLDDYKNWRVEEWEFYKGVRRRNAVAESRDENSPEAMFKKQLYANRSKLAEKMDKYTDFTVVQTSHAEGDDVIAVLSKKPGEHVIITGDKDLTQLVSDRVKVYHPIKKEFIDNGTSYKRELIIRGDAGDGVPNILSVDNSFVDGIRQKPMTKKVVEPLMAAFDVETAIYELKVNGVQNDEIIKNYHRNRKMIDLDYIPETIVDQINKDFDEKSNVGKLDIMQFCIEAETPSKITAVDKFRINKIKQLEANQLAF